MNGLATRLIAVTVALGCASSVFADGFLVVREEPRIAGVYAIPYHHVDIRVDDQVCKVDVKQAFRNPGHRQLEAEYLFPLPEDAAIDNFVMMVDGKEMPGRLLGKEEARRIYESIVRRKKDPALLEYMGRGLFRTSVFPIPPGKQRQVHISYTHLCKRDGNLIEIAYPLGTEKYSANPLDELKINCHIQSKVPIKSVYSSTHSVDVKRPSEHHAEISLVQRRVLPQDDFALVYSVSDADVGLSVLSYRPDTSDAGYFLLLASPKVQSEPGEILPKSVIFVLDKSGSMTGQKIEQAKRSLRFVLKNLRENDTFNIIVYDDDVRSLAPELQTAGGQSVADALKFVDTIAAGGSTNIDGALRTAMDMLKSPDTPSYVIFLTDGLPTAGEKRESAIVDNCTRTNRMRARLMAFGVGNDVNARLLDKLVAGNFGDSQYVRPNEDIEAPVSRLFSKLSAPVLSQLQLDFPGLDSSRTYPKVLPDLFRGNQLVLVGRYHQTGALTVNLRGKIGKREQTYTEQVVLDNHLAPYSRSFVEKLWAERRVGYLIDELDLHGHNQELVQEIVQLSTKYGILTPYTSFLADEEVNLADAAGNLRLAGKNLHALEQTSGRGAVAQRTFKGGKKRAKRAPAKGYARAQSMDGEIREVTSVLNVGQRTFFKKDGTWLDSRLSEKQRKDAVRLVRYSDEYFKIVRSQPATVNQYFAIDGEVTLEVDGRAYRVVND